MKYFATLLLFIFFIFSCKRNEEEATTGVDNPLVIGPIDYRHEMRQFVVHLAQYARQADPNFIVIPQNGQQLCSMDGTPSGPLAIDYAASINGQGREELFYGYDNEDDMPTPDIERLQWLPYLESIRDAGIKILVTDYCSSTANVDDSFAENTSNGFISFAADTRDLVSIPSYPSPIYEENNDDITHLGEASNFLYIINTENFVDKNSFITEVAATNYDLIIMDAFFDDEAYTAAEIEQLKVKANGGNRLVVAYMSIGEAEDYRFYWQSHWSFNAPDWMGPINPDWPGNYKIEYWNSAWQDIIFGNESSYTSKIVTSGFDGVYLDIIDAFEYWEEQ